MLVHAFVMSRVDYCIAILAGSPRYITDKLQRLLNAAARLVTATRKFDHGLSLLLHDEMHWLDIPERVHYKLGVTVHRCLHDKVPKYLIGCCTPVSDIASRRHLRSAMQSTSPESIVGLFCRRSDGLELTQQRPFQTTVEDELITTEYTQRSRDASWLCAI